MLIIANWKENKTLDEAALWLNNFGQAIGASADENAAVLLAPAFPLISFLRQTLLISPPLSRVSLCAQSVSHFEQGAYTGEVAAKQLRGLVDYVIAGHSERRRYFGETNQQINEKIRLCLKYGLTPIVCASSLEQVEALQSLTFDPQPPIIAYEPPFAIGTGYPDDPQHSEKVALEIKNLLGENTKVLYGGSINSANVRSFGAMPHIEGFLVGTASLNAEEFARIIKAAETRWSVS